MALQAVHDTLDQIPEAFQELYTEKAGKYELTGIIGIKTQADIDRLQTSLTKERALHKTTKDKLAVWSDLEHESTMQQLDRIPELEAASKGNLDDAQIEEIVNRRVEGTITSRVSPLERQVTALKNERDEATSLSVALQAEKSTRSIHDNVRSELVKLKVIQEAHEDALMLADRVFEIREDDGAIVTRDQIGVTPGVTADIWLSEMQEKRPHWWPASQGGGARGGNNARVGGFANNPFSREHWNMTRQGSVVRTQGIEKATQMAKAAGTTVGGQMPADK